MKIQTFRDRMMTDPDFAFSFIVLNNEEEVTNRLRGLDYSINGPDDCFEALNDLLEKHAYQDIRSAFGVPMTTEGVDPAVVATVQSVASGMKQATRAKMGPLDNDNSVPDVEEGSSGTSDSGGGAGQWFGAILGGFASMWTASQNPPANVNAVDTTSDTDAAPGQQAAANAKRNRYILIGVVVVVAITILIVGYKAMKK